MKGSAITGPVGKEAAELWPVSVVSTLFDFVHAANMFPRSVLRPTLVSSCKLGYTSIETNQNEKCNEIPEWD